jgi:hypothetical protein
LRIYEGQHRELFADLAIHLPSCFRGFTTRGLGRIETRLNCKRPQPIAEPRQLTSREEFLDAVGGKIFTVAWPVLLIRPTRHAQRYVTLQKLQES